MRRRDLFGLAASGLFLPRRLLADETRERKFLFVFCPGGWDPTMVFAPVFNATTDHDGAETAATIGGLGVVDAPTRPSVRAFFETWGNKTCVINGLEVPSVAHEACRKWLMTGNIQLETDDWVSVIAGHAESSRILPNLHISGPLFPHQYANASVRIGQSGQLPGLVDGTALQDGDTPVVAPSADADALEEAFVRARVDAWAAAARPGMARRVGTAEQLALNRSAQLVGLADDLDTGYGDDLSVMARVAVGALTAGLSRTSILAYGTGGNGIWDTHTENHVQDGYFEELFSVLGQVMEALDAAPGEVEATMLEETTIVVISEMGRTPQLNSVGGKDHWAWTSAMLVGAGVAGGRTIGAWNEDLTGHPVDLASGEATENGVILYPGHLGATLLALADIDPGEYVDPTLGDVIMGALS